MTKPPRLMILLAFAALYLVWGSSYLAILYAVEGLPPFLLAGLRYVTAGVILFAWARWQRAPLPTAAQWRSAALLGFMLLSVGNGTVVWAEQQIPSWVAAIMVSTVPLFLAVLDRRERTPLAPVALGFLGILLLVAPGASGEVGLLGSAVVLAGSASWAVGTLLARTAAVPEHPMMATGLQMLAGGAILVVGGMALGEHEALARATPTPRALWALAYLTFFGSVLTYTAYVWLLRHVPTRQVATYAYVNPVVAVLLGWAFAGEALTLLNLAAVAIILVSVVLLMQEGSPAPRQRFRIRDWLRQRRIMAPAEEA